MAFLPSWLSEAVGLKDFTLVPNQETPDVPCERILHGDFLHLLRRHSNMFTLDDALLKLCFFSERIHVPVQDAPDVPHVGDPHEGSTAPFEEAPRSVPQSVLASRPQGPDGLSDHQPSGEHPAKAFSRICSPLAVSCRRSSAEVDEIHQCCRVLMNKRACAS